MTWKLADAKNRLSELVNLVIAEGPQKVSRRGDLVVVLSWEDYERLSGEKPSFKDLLINGPTLDGVDLERDQTPMREVEL